MTRRNSVWPAAILGLAMAMGALAHEDHANHAKSAATYTRSVQQYAVPDLALTSIEGKAVGLSALLETDKPVLVNFVFTSCSAICPVMSATFAQVQQRLGERRDDVRLVSISIDPEQDTPARLRDYAARFRTRGGEWVFLTGGRNAIRQVQDAFDVNRGNKTNHLPLTFLRANARSPWVRVEGLASADQLLHEVARARTL